ncbi:MAG: hypothetical protein AB1567_10240 [bacterium]
MEEKETNREAIKTIYEYSQNFYEEQRNRFDRLDAKSTNLVTFAGIIAGLGLFSTQFFFGEDVKTPCQIIFYILSFGLYMCSILCFLLSTLFALKAYRVREICTIPTATKIIEWYRSEKISDKSEERILKLLAYRMSQGADNYLEKSDGKVEQIKISEKFLKRAIVLMAIFIGIFTIMKIFSF